MTVKLEIKDQLAKLLATEDLIVEHKNVSTASFDVEKRVLVLPTWDRASNNVYDLLVGHEVGHALYTPNEDLSKFKAPQTYINVTEDARIEKLIKRKFPGLAKSFYRGYWELNEKDFFGVEDEGIENLSFIDRINLYFKGNVDIQFTDEEKVFVKKTGNTETFEEACNIAEEIYSYSKTTSQKNASISQEESDDADSELPDYIDSDLTNGDNDNTEDGDDDSKGEGDNGTDDGRPDLGEDTTEYESGGNKFEMPEEGITDRNLQDRLEDLISDNVSETVYLEIPDVNLDSVIVSTETVWGYFDKKINDRIESCKASNFEFHGMDKSDDEYRTFKKSAQKEVNYLVKEFECKKAASSYARTATARTGVLDTKNLHTYRFNEDIFKKISVIPEGKNHGLIFILDWSGSMYNVIEDTVKQLFNLVWFCRKVNIPFEVYAFTNEWYRNCDDNSIPQIPYGESLHQESIVNQISVDSAFNLLNILSSKTRAKDFDDHCRKLFHLTSSPMTFPRLCLSGTPLNESIITLHNLIPKFKKEQGVEKLNTIILTDGESQSVSYFTEYTSHSGEVHMGKSGFGYRCVLRDRKLGRTYRPIDGWSGVTKSLLTNISEKFPSVNFIGIRLMEGSSARRFINNNCDYNYDMVENMMKVWKKRRSISLDNTGYKKYFGISSSSLSNQSEFEVSEDASKSQIKRAFVKSCGAKKLNKKILSEFIELIV